MRAYVASLIAVFLALAIGILLGTVIQERAPLVDQIEKQVKNLQSDFAVVRDENKTLSRQIEVDLAFAKKVLPVIADGKLSGKSVALVSSGHVSKQVVRKVAEGLEDAGAEVMQVDMLKYGLDEGLRKNISGYLPTDDDSTADAGSDGSTPDSSLKTGKPVDLTKLVAEAITDSEAKPAISDLVQLGVVRLNDPPIQDISAVVLLVDPATDEQIADSFLLPVSKEISSLRVGMIAAESGLSLQSLMPAFNNEGITTIDNIDEVTGEISLILTVAGEKGSFGKKKGADDIIPPLN